jgi:rhodanese-related sulfurtransferase
MKKIWKLFARQRESVTPAEAKLALASGAVLVDVREQSEWQAGHAADAVHIPLGQISKRLGELPTDRQLILVCRSGHRSGIAVNVLSSNGIKATNLTGGMNAWTAAGLPTVNSGEPRDHSA